MSSKNKKQFACSACGSIQLKWSGQCFDCQAWGTINEDVVVTNIYMSNSNSPLNIETFDGIVKEQACVPTQNEEINRVLGGGLVSGSVILIGGDPGIGKSTLLLQLTATLSSSKICSLYVTGEESVEQVKLRSNRLGLKHTDSFIIAATNIGSIIATLNSNKNKIDLVVIDSIQTMHVDEVSSAPGTVSQIRASAYELINYAKKNNVIIFLVGHITKDGQLAGPKILEHMVDTVLYFEGDLHNNFRILRSIKNRFGGVNEIGVFEMTSKGLEEVSNPSAHFLADRKNNISGSAVFAGIEGTRPILVEIQALISISNTPMPRRSVVGWDINRLSMILAILNIRYGLNLTNYEVYLSVAGGLKITEPAADLAVVAAIISAANNHPISNKQIFIGEMSLSGEVRKVSQPEARIKEAKKLGFTSVICAKAANLENNDMVQTIEHIKQLKSMI